MTPENIHVNSFMYEPIIDMSDVHLRQLYTDVQKLSGLTKLVRGHEKVPTGGQVEVSTCGQIKLPTPCSSCRSGTAGPDGDGERRRPTHRHHRGVPLKSARDLSANFGRARAGQHEPERCSRDRAKRSPACWCRCPVGSGLRAQGRVVHRDCVRAGLLAPASRCERPSGRAATRRKYRSHSIFRPRV